MEPEKKSNGALVGLVVIVLILIIGGLYMWQVNKNAAEKTEYSQAGSVTNQDSAELNALEQNVSSADSSTGVDATTIR